MATRNAEWPNFTATRFPGLGVTKTGPVWRFMVEGATVGPQFKTKLEAMAEVGSYAREYGLSDNAGDCPRCGFAGCRC